MQIRGGGMVPAEDLALLEAFLQEDLLPSALGFDSWLASVTSCHLPVFQSSGLVLQGLRNSCPYSCIHLLATHLSPTSTGQPA